MSLRQVGIEIGHLFRPIAARKSLSKTRQKNTEKLAIHAHFSMKDTGFMISASIPKTATII
jgi:hypothetical protein